MTDQAQNLNHKANETNDTLDVLDRMVAEIIRLTAATGGCMPQDLNASGFNVEEVVTYWHAAKELAAVEIKRTKEKNKK